MFLDDLAEHGEGAIAVLPLLQPGALEQPRRASRAPRRWRGPDRRPARPRRACRCAARPRRRPSAPGASTRARGPRSRAPRPRRARCPRARRPGGALPARAARVAWAAPGLTPRAARARSAVPAGSANGDAGALIQIRRYRPAASAGGPGSLERLGQHEPPPRRLAVIGVAFHEAPEHGDRLRPLAGAGGLLAGQQEGGCGDRSIGEPLGGLSRPRPPPPRRRPTLVRLSACRYSA